MPIINQIIFTGKNNKLQEKVVDQNGVTILPDNDFDGISKAYINIKDAYKINTTTKVGNSFTRPWEEGYNIFISDPSILIYDLELNDEGNEICKFNVLAPGLVSLIIEDREGMLKSAEYFIIEMSEGTYVAAETLSF